MLFAASVVSATLVLDNGTVHTLDARRPRAQAVAITGGVISAVGTRADIQPFIGPATRVIDLEGQTVIPGFHDSHAHLLNIGLAKMSVDLVGAASYREVIERVAPVTRSRPAGQWIVGRGWHEGKWKEATPGAVRGFPTHAALTAASPHHPVVLTRADGHALLANARAMQLAGITAETRAPEGGEILRDADGRPTGIFVDNAQALIRVPPPDDEQRRRALGLALQECLADGVTSVDDAGAGPEMLSLYKERAEAGALPVRVYAMAGGFETLKTLERPQIDVGHGFFTVRSVKLYVDGALGSRGAALLEPYADDPKNSGLLVNTPAVLLEATRHALAKGFQVCTHAIGDRGNRIVLDTYERAMKENAAVKDPRLRIEHAQILDALDIPRFARLGVIASMQGIHATSDRPWAKDRLGMERVTEGAYVWQKLLKSGAHVTNGTDAPVEDLNPLRCLYASVTRQDEAGQPTGGFDPDQRMTREEALRSYTWEPAYATFQEERLGSIEAGKRADLTVLSKDIVTVPPAEILSTEVVYTIVDGVLRFQRDE
jgi:predicted amidohydrolase YtcJ